MSASLTVFPPTLHAANERVLRVRPSAYAKTRNFLDGAVTHLSPYLTHGLTTIPECVASIKQRHALSLEDKLIYEFGWREYFQHVWSVLGDQILRDIRQPVWRGRYHHKLPEDVRRGATGVKVIDESVRNLYRTGYLHNHARMWIASYVVHVRKVHWRAGADWMYAHLLDGDLASNHLSWQWVAGTFSHKPYLFNAENVARYAPAWDCSGTVIDTSYPDLDARARSQGDSGAEPGQHSEVDEPKTGNIPSQLETDFELIRGMDDLSQRLEALRGQRIELIHPWNLGSIGQRAGAEPAATWVAWLDPQFHQLFGWSEQRWHFVLTRMRQLTSEVWIATGAELTQACKLAGQTVHTLHTLNPSYADLCHSPCSHTRPVPRLLPNPSTLHPSFTRFFEAARQLMTHDPLQETG